MDAVLMAELAQARKQVERLASEREMWIRIVAVLSTHLSAGREVPMIDGCPVVRRSDFEAVPQLWTVGVEPGTVNPVGEDGKPLEGVEPFPVLRVVVKPKIEGPILTVPRGVPSVGGGS